jgi:glycosyltransferase involved in cell wall biosynthesis
MPIPKLIVLGNFLRQRPTGVQRYAIELTRALAARNPGLVTLLAPPGVPVPERLSDVPVVFGSCLGTLGRGFPGWAFLDAPAYLNARGVDGAVVWNPSNIGAPHIPNQVITLHDLSFYRYPWFFSRRFRYKHKAACAVTLPRVLGVTTVSQAVRTEIEARFPFLRGRVDVVYNGVSEHFVRRGRDAVAGLRLKHGLPERYFLAIGSLDPRKNISALIRAYVDGGVHARTGIGLVLAGGKFSSFSEDRGLASLLAQPGVRHLGYVPDDDLPALYSGCQAFVMPSVYEGFGIPIIEALACGAPVLCSDIPVFREVGGSRVRYFSPYAPDSLRDALSAACVLAPDPGNLGGAIAAAFSWDKSAERFEATLRRFQPARAVEALAQP